MAWEQGFTGFWRNFFIRIVRDWIRQMNEKVAMLLAKELSNVLWIFLLTPKEFS